jgi:PAS domain S-box-containing protein
VVILLAFSLFLQLGTQAQVKTSRRMLILHEVNPAYPIIWLIDEGIRTGLQKLPYKIGLDTVLLPDPAAQMEFREFYLLTRRNRTPGKTVAELTLRILGEEKPQSIPRVRNVGAFLSDWRALRHGSLSENNLPPGSVLLLRQPGFWEAYRRYIVPAALLFLVQSAVIGALLWQRAKRKRAEVNRLWRVELESLISCFSSTFMSLREDEVDANIERSVARLGEFLKLDRISLFELSSDQAEMTTAFSWQAAGVVRAESMVKAAAFQWWRGRLLRGEVSLASDEKDLPKDAAAEREYFRRAAVVSAASVPLKVNGQVAGAISFVTTKRRVSWTPDLVSQLQVVGEILWNALLHKRALSILRESEELFRLAANTAPVMIWMSEIDTRKTFFNQWWLEFTGRLIGAEVGEGWKESVHPEDLRSYLEGYAQSFGRREPFRREYRLRRRDGEYRWILDHAIPRFNADRSFAGYIGCGVDVTDRKRAEAAFSMVSRKLIEAQEQERAWIARQLRDDFNQRLALLAVGLQAFREELPASQVQARHRVEEACESVCGLSADIHALSHRLHSSKLELLGLVAASMSFCKELADRRGVEIDFHCEDVPNDLSKEISLCLFRVLQEALRNAIKHSGSRQFEVSLRGGENEMTMTVRDSGTGFHTESAINGKGLGLTCMGERLKLIAGQLVIDSQPRCGTTIRARVALDLKPMAVGAGTR